MIVCGVGIAVANLLFLEPPVWACVVRTIPSLILVVFGVVRIKDRKGD
jgi:hypothetical protein